MDYYKAAKAASLKINNSGLLYLQNKCATSSKILDVGCGEGSRLDTLSKKPGSGVDVNSKAIKEAKQQFPKHHFQVADAAKLPFEDDTFDLVYSAYAIEHCLDPEKFVMEMFRVCKVGGEIVILTPNYGAPNRRSPVSAENPITKFVQGLLTDYTYSKSLNWKHVQPKRSYDQPDDDTTVEPYLHTLVRFIHPHKITKQSSLWELEKFSLNPRKLFFSILGRWNIFPFKYWGPQIFVATIK